MKTIHRAILEELLGSMLVSFAALDMVLMTDNIFRQSKEFGSVGASLTDIIALVQSQIAVITIPMAFFIAVLLTTGRLTARSRRSGQAGMTIEERHLP